VDIIAVNSYGEDPKVFRTLLQECRTRYPEKPIIVSRYGYDVEPGNRSGYSSPLSMESQARYIMQFLSMVQDVKIGGSVLWSYNDWRTDRPSLSTRSQDPYLNTLGIVSYDREKRTSFDVVRSIMNDEKVQALPVGNYSSNAPIIFVIAGFIVLISFAFMYNANRRFRDAVNRSLMRTYNFFADVRDQRILTYGHSTILAFVIAITWATVVSSILMYYRNDHLLDNLLSQVLSDRMKEWLVQLAWDPIRCIAILSGIILLKFLLISVLVKLFSMMVRTRVYYYHAYSITIWSMLPFIILIPLSMILFRLLDAQFYIVPIFILIGILVLWVLFRLFKGVSIIYDIYPIKVYAVGLLFIIIVCLAIYGYLDYAHSTTLYVKYLLQTAR
jgi:beta-galactosidase